MAGFTALNFSQIISAKDLQIVHAALRASKLWPLSALVGFVEELGETNGKT